MIAGGHPLVDLAELRLAEQPDQLGLPDEDDLEELLPARLQVGEEAHLLQHVGGEVLGLVEDHHGPAAPTVGVEEVAVQRIDRRLAAPGSPLVGDAQLLADRGQELEAGQPRV